MALGSELETASLSALAPPSRLERGEKGGEQRRDGGVDEGLALAVVHADGRRQLARDVRRQNLRDLLPEIDVHGAPFPIVIGSPWG